MRPFSIISSKNINTLDQKLPVRLLLDHDGLMTTLLSTITKSKIHINLLSETTQTTIYKPLADIQITAPVERLVELKATPKVLAIGRSFWNAQAYHKMIKNKNSGIGQNMLNNRVEYFRDINWKGVSTIEVLGQTHKDIYSRSYKMYHQKELVCQIEEYFLPQIMGYFQNSC